MKLTVVKRELNGTKYEAVAAEEDGVEIFVPFSCPDEDRDEFIAIAKSRAKAMLHVEQEYQRRNELALRAEARLRRSKGAGRMSTDLAVRDVEVLEPGEQTLAELAETAEREHELVVEAGESMVAHAIAAGDVLLEARGRFDEGGWQDWVDTSSALSVNTALLYMRLARYRDQIADFDSINQARQYLIETGTPAARRGVAKQPPWLREEAQRLRAEGESLASIATALGVSYYSVWSWFNPGKRNANTRKYRHRRRAAEKALQERQRDAAIKRAVKKAGAATAEAWTMAERMQDVLAQAQRETEDPEAREALSLAGKHYRKMRDEIVRALGVS